RGKGEVTRTYACDVDVDRSAFTDRASATWLHPQFRKSPPTILPKVRLSVQKLPAVRAVPSELFVNKEQATRFPVERRLLLLNEADGSAFDATMEESNSWIEVERLPTSQEKSCLLLVRIQAIPQTSTQGNRVFQREICL